MRCDVFFHCIEVGLRMWVCMGISECQHKVLLSERVDAIGLVACVCLSLRTVWPDSLTRSWINTHVRVHLALDTCVVHCMSSNSQSAQIFRNWEVIITDLLLLSPLWFDHRDLNYRAHSPVSLCCQKRFQFWVNIHFSHLVGKMLSSKQLNLAGCTGHKQCTPPDTLPCSWSDCAHATQPHFTNCLCSCCAVGIFYFRILYLSPHELMHQFTKKGNKKMKIYKIVVFAVLINSTVQQTHSDRTTPHLEPGLKLKTKEGTPKN